MTGPSTEPGTPAVHRIDMPIEQAGFPAPPCPVQLKFLPSPQAGGWTLLANVLPGDTRDVAAWLAGQEGFGDVSVAPGIAPRLVRARAAALPPAWSEVATFVAVHHLDLRGPNASWFVEAGRNDLAALLQRLRSTGPSGHGAAAIRCRAIQVQGRPAAITRRQQEVLSTAVALGYYEIPHRIDLRSLARHTGVSLGSVSELLRRAESTVLSHHVDASLLAWSGADEEGGPVVRR
jgi:hypothetical protein